jgi:hypothetical protein
MAWCRLRHLVRDRRADLAVLAVIDALVLPRLCGWRGVRGRLAVAGDLHGAVAGAADVSGVRRALEGAPP